MAVIDTLLDFTRKFLLTERMFENRSEIEGVHYRHVFRVETQVTTDPHTPLAERMEAIRVLVQTCSFRPTLQEKADASQTLRMERPQSPYPTEHELAAFALNVIPSDRVA